MNRSSIQVYSTVRDTDDRLTQKEQQQFDPDVNDWAGVVNVYSDVEYQKWIGFGGSFTEASADTFYKLSPELRKEVMDAYFDPKNGHAYTVCRTHMNSCDFSISNYSCDDIPGDVSLSSFNIEHDKKQIIPMIKEGMKYGPLNLLFTPWSPPGWMKTTGTMNNGGSLLPEYRQVWADFYAKFIQKYHEEGIDFWGLTVQNEPLVAQVWDSCKYTAEEEKEFVRDYLAPTLKKNNLDMKIIIWDHNKDVLYERASEELCDEDARNAIWGMGFHWYAGDHFEALDAFHQKWPEKQLIHTEGCKEYGPSYGDWAIAERYGHDIIGDLNNYVTAYCDWNLILNDKGGPNHVNNLCDASILVKEDGTLLYESSYWYIGHFSRFIRPGSVRVASSTYCDRVETTAFKNPDGTIALVVMNKTDAEEKFTLRYAKRGCRFVSKPHSIMTLLFAE